MVRMTKTMTVVALLIASFCLFSAVIEIIVLVCVVVEHLKSKATYPIGDFIWVMLFFIVFSLYISWPLGVAIVAFFLELF
jgi:hypothetical protein